MSDEFESVKGSGVTWEPKQTGSTKNQDLVHLEASDKSYIIGYYLGSKPNQGPKQNSTVHTLKMVKVGDKKHIIGDLDDSQEVSIWGTNVLDGHIAKINVGDYCKITWEGKKAPQKGGNEYHSWDVGVSKSVEPLKMGNAAAVGVTGAPASQAPESSPVVAEKATASDEDDDLPF